MPREKRHKPRGDAKLKRLTADRQEQVVEWLNTGTQAETMAKIQDTFGFSTSPSALSAFYDYFHWCKRIEEAGTRADHVVQALRGMPGMELDEERMLAVGQMVFEMDAIEAKDFRQFYDLRRLRQKDKALRQSGKRVSLLEAKAQEVKDRLEGIKSKGGLTEETLREIEATAKLL